MPDVFKIFFTQKGKRGTYFSGESYYSCVCFVQIDEIKDKKHALELIKEEFLKFIDKEYAIKEWNGMTTKIISFQKLNEKEVEEYLKNPALIIRAGGIPLTRKYKL